MFKCIEVKSGSRFFVALLCVLCVVAVKAQDFSNRGKDFWLGYGYHVKMNKFTNNNTNTQDMVLYFTAEQNCEVTVEIPSLGYQKKYQVIANKVTIGTPLPKSGAQDCRISDVGKFARGIHITSTQPVVAYAHLYNDNISGASILYPTNTLGREYYVIGYAQNANESDANAYFFVVATEDSTWVEISPSNTNLNGIEPYSVFTIMLNKGEIYNVMGTYEDNKGADLTGSKVRSVNRENGGCKKIAVFSGAGKISIGGNNTGSADNLFAQALPASAWGLKYLTAPTGSQPNNYFRICVPDSTTNVKLNGVLLSKKLLHGNGFFYELKNSTPLTKPGDGRSVANSITGTFNVIEADKPIAVAQFCTTQGQDGNPTYNSDFVGGDPEMIYLSPVEQTINKVTLYSATANAIEQSFINVIIPRAGVATFVLDGVNYAASFKQHPSDAAYAYAILPVNSGSHTFSSNVGFNSIAYGFGNVESYGYNAGTNILDLYQYVSIRNTYAVVNFPATCKNAPFMLSVTLPYRPTSLYWDFKNNPNMQPNTNVYSADPIPDSVFVKDNKTLYQYRLPQSYVFSVTGSFPIIIQANNPTPDGCSGIQNIDYDVKVYDPPIADFSIKSTTCVGDSIHFSDATNAFGRSVNKWFWSFGTIGTDSIDAPIKKITEVGLIPVTLKIITDIGCLADTVKQVPIWELPKARFTVTDSCANAAIRFADASTVAKGSIIKWYWNYGNGISDTLSAGQAATPIYQKMLNYVVSLRVLSNDGCLSQMTQQSFNLRPVPVPDFSLPLVCLPSGKALFKNLTTIEDGTESACKYVWSFGDGKTDSVAQPTHSYVDTGSYFVRLKATSLYGCVRDTVKLLSSVFRQPIAKLGVDKSICERTVSRFTDSSTVVNGKVVKWWWLLDAAKNIVDSVSSPKYQYAQADSHLVKLVVYSDKGCISDTLKEWVVVHALPVAKFNQLAAACEQTPIAFEDASTTSKSTIKSWYWQTDTGDGIKQWQTSKIDAIYRSWGAKYMQLCVTNSYGCTSDTLKENFVVHALPKPGFAMPAICLKDKTAQFTDTSSIDEASARPFGYEWNMNVGNLLPRPVPLTLLTIANPKVAYDAVNNYAISQKVSSQFGCSATAQQIFTVNGTLPKAKFSVLSKVPFCSKDSLEIQNNSSVEFGKITRLAISWDAVNAPTAITTDNLALSGNGLDGKKYHYPYPAVYWPDSSRSMQLKLMVYSGDACVDSTFQMVSLLPIPSVQIDGVPAICANEQPTRLTQGKELSGLPGQFYYLGKAITGAKFYNAQLASPGIDTIWYKFVAATGGCSDSVMQTIHVLKPPLAKWGVGTPVCEKNNVSLMDSSQRGDGKLVEWIWNWGDGSTVVQKLGEPLVHQYAQASAKPITVSLQVRSDSGCLSNEAFGNVLVHPLPKVHFSVPLVCLPDSKSTFSSTSTIADSSEALFRYKWLFSDVAQIYTLPLVTRNYTALPPSGGYWAKLVIESKAGCTDSLKQTIAQVFQQPVAQMQLQPKALCLGQSVAFSDRSDTTNGVPIKWSWTFGKNDTINTESGVRRLGDSGKVVVRYSFVNNKGCKSNVVVDTVSVYPYPHLQLGGALLALENVPFPLQPANLSGAYVYGQQLRYLWSTQQVPNYLSSDTVLVPISTLPATLDSIWYRLQLTGLGNCSVVDSILVKVLHNPTVTNAFSPNGDAYNQTWHIDNIDAYPNALVEVFNRYGQLVYRKVGYTNSQGWDGTYNGQPLPAGVYYYLIRPQYGQAVISGAVSIIR
jgi:gliding motility-associated-like protein